MDTDKVMLWVSVLAGAVATAIPFVVKVTHALGYEVPLLSRLADWIAKRRGE